MTRTLFSAEKFPWFISLILSIIYFITFLAAASGQSFADKLLFGFCVWGSPELPNKEIKCTDSPINSHIIAFAIDVIFTLAVYIIYRKDTSPIKSKLIYFSFGAIILVHGALHFFLTSPLINCYREIPPGSTLEEIGYILFGIFTFFLCLIIFGSANSGLSRGVFIQSTVSTSIVFFLTRRVGNGEFILTGLFCVVHPISSWAALTSDNPQFTMLSGWWFVVATTVGILELYTCGSFFRAIGGHFYYDLTLHLSILFSLPYFVVPKIDDDKKKMK